MTERFQPERRKNSIEGLPCAERNGVFRNFVGDDKPSDQSCGIVWSLDNKPEETPTGQGGSIFLFAIGRGAEIPITVGCVGPAELVLRRGIALNT